MRTSTATNPPEVWEYAVDATGCIVWLETEDDYEYIRESFRDNVPDVSEWD